MHSYNVYATLVVGDCLDMSGMNLLALIGAAD